MAGRIMAGTDAGLGAGPGMGVGQLTQPMDQAQQSAAEFTHLATAFADCIEAVPPPITRNITDLRELDAVLSGTLQVITDKINRLLALLEDASVSPVARLSLLREIVEEARAIKLGGEDKIRVATSTCETLKHFMAQLDILANLLTNLLPASMAGTIAPPTWPQGYPVLFSTAASASGSAYRQPEYLPTVVPLKNHPIHGHATGIEYYANRQVHLYDTAAGAVRGYRHDGLPGPDQAYIQSQVAASSQAPPSHLPPAANRRPRGGKGEHGSGKGRGGRPPNGSGRSKDDDANFIPYANPARIRGSLDAVAEGMASSIGEGGPPVKKRRPAKDKQHSQSDYGENGNGDTDVDYLPPGSAQPPYLEAHKRERQASNRSSVPLVSPVVANATIPSHGKRARGTTKRANEVSPDPGSPHASTFGNGNGKTASSAFSSNGPKRKSSTMLDNMDVDADYGSQDDPDAHRRQQAPRSATKVVDKLGVPPLVHSQTDGGADGENAGTASETDLNDNELDLDLDLDPADDGGEDTRTYCYCNKVSYGHMIGCDGDECRREWFHLFCVGLAEAPTGEWFCKECQAERDQEAALSKKRR